MTTPDTTEAPLRYAAQHQNEHLQELSALLRIPSVSTQPERSGDVQKAARWLAEALRTAGLENSRVIETEGHPLVYGEWLHAGEEAPTILIYGHYDVQPAEPLELWETAPFEPEVRGDYLYGRGTADDKGQLYIHIKAVEAYLKTRKELPLNVKFLIEGEEEIGGGSLSSFISEHKEMLKADVAVVSDTAMVGKEQPGIVYGLRGLCYMLLDITGPTRDLHSGSYGGAINNPLNVLGHVIARLKDQDGHVLIPGFYDDVRPLNEEERQMLAEYPFDEEQWLAETGAPAGWGESEYSVLERLGARPTLDVNGIIGGYTGPGGKTVLPSTVHAKISMRLVPDQKPEEIARRFQEYVRSLVPPSVTVKIRSQGCSPATVTSYQTPAVRAAGAAYSEVFGVEPVFMRGGGSIPVVGDFQEHLGLDTVLMGFSLPDDRIHSPNERFYLPNFYQGIETAIHFYEGYAQRAQEEND